MHLLRGILVALILGVAAPAFASHYFLDDISDRFSELALAEFDRFGYRTTEDVLLNVLTPEDRTVLSEATGIPGGELAEIAQMCEMLQVTGVGPRAYALLQAAGVTDVRDLAGRVPEELVAQLAAANAVHAHTGANPHLEVVVGWIGAAADVPLHVEL